MRMNEFRSDRFVWSDIGCFRSGKYNDRTMVVHRELAPPHEMIQMAHHRPDPPPQEISNDKYNQFFTTVDLNLLVSLQTWLRFYQYFL
jgi:hypothetical protein